MRTYKPIYLGKVIPADDTSKLTDFVTNRYDAFSKIYDVCKSSSEKINDIAAIPNSNITGFSVKLSTDSKTLEDISKVAEKINSIIITGDVLSAGK